MSQAGKFGRTLQVSGAPRYRKRSFYGRSYQCSLVPSIKVVRRSDLERAKDGRTKARCGNGAESRGKEGGNSSRTMDYPKIDRSANSKLTFENRHRKCIG